MFDGSKVRIAGTMQTIPLYPYLHKRHSELAPQLAGAIKEMKAAGLIEEYRSKIK